MKGLTLIALSLLLWQCADSNKQPQTDEEMEALMEVYEDSLLTYGQKQEEFAVVTATSGRFTEVMLTYAKDYPDAKKAPECLDKAHMLLTVAGDMKEAVKWGELLIEKYPAYPNRPMVLENLALAYDYSIEPRDSNKVRKYYELLLKENPDMDTEKRDDIERRLLMNDVPFERYQELMMQEETENQ